ncbi:hypothetical protein CN335_12515 [Bacillus thuringiensis]|uniref:hypothetical protein n=1 Tax=Bacillus thuringiensis TaxID=1428 RepID=UPI000BF389F8|nr:hypothetical protein [Bacillus thuringiensis]PFF38998.1 hypothetical protein CN335_12515 [Bacillus thuringiensis]PFT16206.1 hypothetical protein COK83_11495 [Bacillus thuringiensis]HEB2439602.1 hypothetical protein [Bacillus thuringiensis]
MIIIPKFWCDRSSIIAKNLEQKMSEEYYITSTFRKIKLKGCINPADVRFTQDSIKSVFKDKTDLFYMIGQLKIGKLTTEEVDEIIIFESEGKIYSFNNRRLFAFKYTNMPIRYRFATKKEMLFELEEKRKFTTKNDGLSIKIRY